MGLAAVVAGGWITSHALVSRARNAPFRLLIALGALAPGILPALAHASPPDPTWVSGIFDDADFDDVVALATSGTAEFTGTRPPLLPPAPPCAGRPSPGADGEHPAIPPASARSRAPPSA
jgi:hypothetical protein